MAAGDIKGEEAVVVYLTNTGGITKGQLMHCESDGHWEATADKTDYGPFAVATETKLTGVAGKAIVWGRVEMTYSGSNNVVLGGPIMPAAATGDTEGGAAGTVTFASDPSHNVVGMAMEAADTSGNLVTVWLGIGGS